MLNPSDSLSAKRSAALAKLGARWVLHPCYRPDLHREHAETQAMLIRAVLMT